LRCSRAVHGPANGETERGRATFASFDHVVGTSEGVSRKLIPSALPVAGKRHADRFEAFKRPSRLNEMI